jgi:phosphatidylglycerophosphatase A
MSSDPAPRETKLTATSSVILVATGFGFGYSPIAPGTVGALVGIPLVVAGSWLPAPYWQLPGLVLLFFVAVWTAAKSIEFFGTKDPKPCVIDEIVSLPITFVGTPLDPVTLAVGFVLNRVLDIIKPPPARQFERLPGGWGIVADDVASGIYANLLLQLFYKLVYQPMWLSA